MWWQGALACLLVVVIALPGHLVLDPLWTRAFGPLLTAVFRHRRRTASLQALWLDFINMFATVFLALLGGILVLGRAAPAELCWMLIGFAVLSSALIVALVSTKESTAGRSSRSAEPATPMMTAGSVVAILLGVILILARR